MFFRLFVTLYGRYKTMANTLMSIPNDDSQNCPFCSLQLVDTQLNEQTNQNLLKVPKVVESTNKETLL